MSAHLIYGNTYLLTYLLTHSLRGEEYYLKSCHSGCQKISCFLMEPDGPLPVHKSLPLDPILSQTNPVRPINPYIPKVNLNVILPPTPTCSQWGHTFGTPDQNPVNTSPLLMIVNKQENKSRLSFNRLIKCRS
jgi:hypothetical protein